MKKMKKIFAVVAAVGMVAGCTNATQAEKDQAFSVAFEQTFRNPTSENITILQKKFNFANASYINDCNKDVLSAQKAFNQAEALACLKKVNIRGQVRDSDTVEKAQRFFPDAVALYVPACKKDAYPSTAYKDLGTENTTYIYNCALQKATTLNWQRKWYNDQKL